MQETACLFFPPKKLHGKVGMSIKGRLVCKQRNHFYSGYPVSFVKVTLMLAGIAGNPAVSSGFKYAWISSDANPEDIYNNLCCTLLLTLLLIVYY